MRNKIKYCLLLIALLIEAGLYSCATRKSEPISGKVVDNTDIHTRNGQVLYNTYCQKCHPAGEAGLGPSVTSKPGFAKKFQMRHGLGVMPAFKKNQLSKEDLDDIAIYLKKLHHL